MKLKKISRKDPMKRLPLSVRQSTLDLMDEYRAYYKKVHGETIEAASLVEEIIKEFINSDKDFLKVRADLEEAGGTLKDSAASISKSKATPPATPV